MLRILHTGDWHIGQFFHEYDRTYEHQQFLNWFLEKDFLKLAGDDELGHKLQDAGLITKERAPKKK